MLDEITRLTANSPADLIDLEASLGDGWRRWAIRGQPNTYGTLAPSFQRVFRNRQSVGTAEIIETTLLHDFREHYSAMETGSDMPKPEQLAGMYDEQIGLPYLSVMQHYGVPTRLLDWTSHFWTAVYFACTGESNADGELWLYDRDIFGFGSHAGLQEFDPGLTPRMKQQEAYHTYSRQVLDDHAPLLYDLAQQMTAKDDEGRDDPFRRVVVAKTCKDKTLRFLDEQKGITASTVFPDVEGLGRFLRWQLDTLVARLL